jgi:tetrapyrrole methylase family protein/MazG family protein
MDALIQLVETLRGNHGCPWDKKQTPADGGLYLIEEAFELADAIESAKAEQILEELGDVLFHIVFIARMFEERGEFDLSDVVQAITQKMIRRHPHVFGENDLSSCDEVIENWHKIKLAEKKTKSNQSLLDSVPVQLPALIRAFRISDRAAKSGFDWAKIDKACENAEKTVRELKASTDKANHSQLSQKFGDILFALVNLARVAKVHPETALAGSNKRFEMRFKKVENLVAESKRDFESIPLNEKEKIWERVKKTV